MSEEKKGETFADLFAADQAPVRSGPLRVGEQVTGVVAHIGRDAVFVDLPGRKQAFFERIELEKEDGTLTVAVGQRIEAFIVEMDRGQIRLARGLEKGASLDQLRAAIEQGMAVEGTVTGVNKGGAEVDLGGVRAFCPVSQLDNHYVAEPATFVGQTLKFQVTEVRQRDVVVSRRALLEAEAKAGRAAIIEKLKPGERLRGRVASLRDFGAFVDIGGGVEGLIPVRELSHDRQRPEEVVTVGDIVEVQIQEIEERDGKLRVTLSLKALSADPWDAIGTIAPIGQVVSGQVAKLMEFGAFVRLAAGVEGLLHVSELGGSVRHPSERLEVGQSMLVEVRAVDLARKRISLAPAAEGAAAGSAASRIEPVLGAIVTATVDKVERFGVFVQLKGTRGRAGRGLIPNNELAVPQGTDIRKAFPVGAEVTAKILETGEGRLRLSIRGASEDADRAVYDRYREEQVGKASMGTLGDLLKKKR